MRRSSSLQMIEQVLGGTAGAGVLAPDHVKYLVQPPPASPTLKSAMDRLAPHPQLKVDRYRQRSGLSWTLLKRSDTQSAPGDRAGEVNRPSHKRDGHLETWAKTVLANCVRCSWPVP